MDAGAEFVVEIKQSALDRNPWAALLREREGALVEFESESEARETVSDLSNSGDGANVRIQRAADRDSSDCDAYLVAVPETRKRDPDGSLEEGWTFDTTANQYGAIGETLVTTEGTPALDHFVRQDLGPFPDERVETAMRLHVESDPRRMETGVVDAATAELDGEWIPDCEVRASLGDSQKWVHRYFCEIKTGSASYQRSQQEAMAAVAKRADVLKLRVSIDELPSEYSITVRRVGDDEPVVDWESQRRRLDGARRTMVESDREEVKRDARLTEFE